jgi:hypothetical protein
MSVNVDDLKRWALQEFRKMLHGARLTEQFERWAKGELGRDYTFMIEMTLNDATESFVNDARNRAALSAERLDLDPH